MSSAKYEMRRETSGNLSETFDNLIKIMEEKMVSPGIVENSIEPVNGVEVGLLVMEKFFWRNSSMAVAVVQVVSNGNEQSALVISSGGGEGILNISWGANKSFASQVAAAMEECGFLQTSFKYID